MSLITGVAESWDILEKYLAMLSPNGSLEAHFWQPKEFT